MFKRIQKLQKRLKQPCSIASHLRRRVENHSNTKDDTIPPVQTAEYTSISN